jgi:hypothetical protein
MSASAPKGGGPVEIMPSMWEAYDRFLADIEADQDAIAQTASASRKAHAA